MSFQNKETLHQDITCLSKPRVQSVNSHGLPGVKPSPITLDCSLAHFCCLPSPVPPLPELKDLQDLLVKTEGKEGIEYF